MSIHDKFGFASDAGMKHAIFFCKLSELRDKVGAAAWLLTFGGMTRPDTGRIVVGSRDISTLSGPVPF